MKQDACCPVCGEGEVTIIFDPFGRSGDTVECLNCHAELSLDLGEEGEITLAQIVRHRAAG